MLTDALMAMHIIPMAQEQRGTGAQGHKKNEPTDEKADERANEPTNEPANQWTNERSNERTIRTTIMPLGTQMGFRFQGPPIDTKQNVNATTHDLACGICRQQTAAIQ